MTRSVREEADEDEDEDAHRGVGVVERRWVSEEEAIAPEDDDDDDDDDGAMEIRGRRARRELGRARRMREALVPMNNNNATTSKATLEEIYAEVCANAVDGTVIERQLSLLNFLPTGCDGIDDLLGGGLRQGQVTEITGPSASGKTQLCLSAAASAAALGHRVVYVDTTGGFSATRIKQFHRGFFADDAAREEVVAHLKQTLNLIAVHRCHDVFSLLNLLSQLGEEASEDDNNPEHATMGLLVIDSLSALLSPLLTKAHHQGYTIMATVAAMLRGLATTRKTAALYTNHTVSTGQESLADDQGSNLKPALGTRWTSVPHRRLRLCKIPGTGWNSCGVVYGVTAAPARYRVGSNNIHSAPA